MNADHSLMAGSSFQVVSPVSFRNEVEITPMAFSSPAGRSALAIDAAALTSSSTGCQSSSAAWRMARAEIGGAQLSTSTSAPDVLRMSTWVSIDMSASMAISATIVGGDAQALLQSAEEIAAELVVLPEHGDLAVGIGGLDVIGVDPSLGAERRLPAHRPGKAFRMRPLLVAGRDEELGDFFSLRYFRVARLLGVPNEPNISRTFCSSTSSRVSSTAVFGFELSSREMNLILRPLMPPRSLTMSK